MALGWLRCVFWPMPVKSPTSMREVIGELQLSKEERPRYFIIRSETGRRFLFLRAPFMAASPVLREILSDPLPDEPIFELTVAPSGLKPSTSSTGVTSPTAAAGPPVATSPGAPPGNATEEQLRYLESFLLHHESQPYPTIECPLRNDLPSQLPEWDLGFLRDTVMKGVDGNIVVVLALLKTAATFGVVPLRDLCGAFVADWMTSRSDDQILSAMGVSEPFDAEADKAMMKKYPWLAD